MSERGDVMDDLRPRTRPIHERLEASDLVSGRLTDADGLAGLVEGLVVFHASCERRLAAHATQLDGYGLETGRRAKPALLRADAEALGIGLRALAAARMLGRMYVAEGSTPGGLFIGRDVEKRLGFRSRYYGAYGDTTAERWRAFGTALRAYDAAHPTARTEIVDGTLLGFAEFEAALRVGG